VILHTAPALLEAAGAFMPCSLGAGVIAVAIVLFAWIGWSVRGVKPTGQSENVKPDKPRGRP
jgi:hypothetical protein